MKYQEFYVSTISTYVFVTPHAFNTRIFMYYNYLPIHHTLNVSKECDVGLLFVIQLLQWLTSEETYICSDLHLQWLTSEVTYICSDLLLQWLAFSVTYISSYLLTYFIYSEKNNEILKVTFWWISFLASNWFSSMKVHLFRILINWERAMCLSW